MRASVVVVWLACAGACGGKDGERGVPDATPAETLRVVEVAPSPHSHAPADATISIRFDRPVRRASVSPGSLWAFARWSGAITGTLSFDDGDRVVSLAPDAPLSAGESVMVLISRELESADGAPMRAAGYGFQFNVAAAPALATFTQIEQASSRADPEEFSQAYGGIASDLNDDGWMDITVVNETSEDLAVLLNTADGTGRLHDLITPTPKVGARGSPSEPHDFDRDGHTDITVANIGERTGSISILLGNGDGTFVPRDEVPVGRLARGVAVFDADGDGDVDIVNTNAGDDTLSLLRNDGAGGFGAPETVAAKLDGAWALAAADMDGDGIFDLVVGARTGETVHVLRGNGDGSFTETAAVDAGGGPWMLNAGDLDGDGAPDVALANGTSDSGAILLNDGTGGLGAPRVYPTDPRVFATDIADLDGDGDADWVLSSFGGNWSLFENDGAGVMSFRASFPATQAASCALLADMDNDGDVDLTLIDELDDIVYVYRNDNDDE